MRLWAVTVDKSDLRTPIAMLYVEAETAAEAKDKVRDVLAAAHLTAWPKSEAKDAA